MIKKTNTHGNMFLKLYLPLSTHDFICFNDVCWLTWTRIGIKK